MASLNGNEPDLGALRYQFVAGPSGGRSDFVLRQQSDPTAGFAWAGQENFDQLGRAVFRWAKDQLGSLCGLEPLRDFGPATPYATPGLRGRAAPVLLLIPGDVPGGDCGTWSRRLSINDTTTSGAMFEYIFRAQDRGWSVVVTDPHPDTSPHHHMQQLWSKLLRDSQMTRLLIVGHSYGGPVSMGLLKAEPGACERMGALVLTDGAPHAPPQRPAVAHPTPAPRLPHALWGRAPRVAPPLLSQPGLLGRACVHVALAGMAWHPSGWGSGEMVDERVPSEEELTRQIEINDLAEAGGEGKGSGESREEMRAMRERCQRFAATCPAAFAPATPEVRACVARVARKYAASTLTAGTPMRIEGGSGLLVVSAGSDSHGDTTHAAMEHAFAFLESGASGGAEAANAQPRADLQRGSGGGGVFGLLPPGSARRLCDGSLCSMS